MDEAIKGVIKEFKVAMIKADLFKALLSSVFVSIPVLLLELSILITIPKYSKNLPNNHIRGRLNPTKGDKVEIKR
jgi:hypothetical protein